MANSIGSDPRRLDDRQPSLWAAVAVLPSDIAQSPTAGGRKSLGRQDVGAMLVLSHVSTHRANRAHSLFSRAAAAAASTIRSAAGLLRRRPAVGGSRPKLRVHPWRVSGAVPRLPSRPAPRLLCRRAA